MPAESQAQRDYLNWRFGHAWVKQHGFDNKGPLPAHVKKAGRTAAMTEMKRKKTAAKTGKKVYGKANR